MSEQTIEFTLAQTDPFTRIGLDQTAPLDIGNARQFIPIAGESAYELAVALGFVGTEEEWIASLSYSAGIDYVPTSRTITINGVTFDLTADRSWTIEAAGGDGGVTVYGTAGRIVITNGYIDIDTNYRGQGSIDTVGTIANGVWRGSKITDVYINSAGTWNAKQGALNGTGFVKSAGGVISYDPSTYALSVHNHDGVYSLVSHNHTGVYQPIGTYATLVDVSTAIANLVNTAPSTLDTLNEIATALGNDPNFASTITTLIGGKQNALIGTGIVKSADGVISYDTTVYQPAGDYATRGELPVGFPGFGLTHVRAAYGDHNHDSEYMPIGGSVAETDPIFVASVAHGITSTNISNWNEAYTDNHTHANYSVLNAITATLISEWNAKSNFDGAYSSLSGKPTIPTNTNQLTNGSGFLTTETEPEFNASVAHGIDSADIIYWNNKSDFDGAYSSLSGKPTLFDGTYAALSGKPTIPTQYTDALAIAAVGPHPTTLPASDVSAWAKASVKPSYTFSEIGTKPTTLGGYGITDTPWTSAGYLTGTKVDSFNTRTGAVTLTKADVETILTGEISSHTHDPHIAINNQTGTSYTLVLTDSFKMVTCANAATITVTIPTNASVAFPVGTQIDLVQYGAGKITMAGSGVTINSKGGLKSTNGQWVGISIVKTATDTWLLVGDLIA